MGLLKIPKFLELYEGNNFIQKNIHIRFFEYNDWNVCMLINMIRNAQLFGGYQNLSKKIYMDVLSCLKEDSYHSQATIVQLGEISERMFFVTHGKVGVFLNMTEEYGFRDKNANLGIQALKTYNNRQL